MVTKNMYKQVSSVHSSSVLTVIVWQYKRIQNETIKTMRQVSSPGVEHLKLNNQFGICLEISDFTAKFVVSHLRLLMYS